MSLGQSGETLDKLASVLYKVRGTYVRYRLPLQQKTKNHPVKRISILLALAAISMMAQAQPRLKADNIDAVISAMTVEEKVGLLIGNAVATYKDGVPTGTSASVPGAAGCTRPIERLGIPGIILSDGPAGVHIDATREGSDRAVHLQFRRLG